MESPSRQRILDALRHKQPDRTPIFEYVLLSPRADDFLGKPFFEYAGSASMWLKNAEEIGFEKALRQYAADRIEIASILGHDMLYVCPNPLPGFSCLYDPLLELSGQFEMESEADPVQRLKRRNTVVEETRLGPLPEDSYLVFHFLKEEMGRKGLDLPVLAPAYFHGIWTDIDLMQVILLDPETARRHFALATKRALRIIDDYLSLGIELIGIGGDFAGNSLLISPGAYREFIVPEVRALARHIRKGGSYSVNATDGNLWEVLEDFLIGCEVDAYLEIDSGAGMDLDRLKKAYGSRITFLGNMDCGKILTLSSPDEIRSITRAILESGTGDGGHIFTASNAITSSVPLQNYLAMVNSYRDFFSLPTIRL